MTIAEQGARPTGLSGTFMGHMMNRYHTSIYKQILKPYLPSSGADILDVGCGGGKFLSYLGTLDPSWQLNGTDHSMEMVALARKTNKETVKSGRTMIVKGDVMMIPFGDESMNFVTANETVQFWPDIDVSFKEILRVLKPGGRFLIINRYPKPGTKWWYNAKIKSAAGFKRKLIKTGFSNTVCDIETKPGWIIVSAEKFRYIE